VPPAALPGCAREPNEKAPTRSAFAEPSDGLEPSTGDRITLPDTIRVTSRPSRSHYALVCSVTDPLDIAHLGSLRFGELRNLLSGHRLGASQVTAVVSREVGATPAGDGGHVVALRARLVEPYFVRVAARYVETRIEAERRAA
jgi:hypothetical protein